jgi:hypothetical protein
MNNNTAVSQFTQFHEAQKQHHGTMVRTNGTRVRTMVLEYHWYLFLGHTGMR